MNLKGITSKLASNAKTIGKLYGYLGPMAAAMPGNELENIMKQHEQALTSLLAGKLPKPENILAVIKQYYTMGILKNSLIAYIIGEVGGGIIGARNAKALKDFGMEAAKYSILSAAVISWDWNPHPPANMGGGHSSGGDPMKGEYNI